MSAAINFYLVAANKSMRQVTANKFCLNYADGSHITLENSNSNDGIVVRGYWGSEEFSSSVPETSVFFSIFPKSCNGIALRYQLQPVAAFTGQEAGSPTLLVIDAEDRVETIIEREIVVDYGNGQILEIVIGGLDYELLFCARQHSDKLVLLKMTPGGSNLVVLTPEFK